MSDDSLLAKLAEEFTAEVRAGNAVDIERYACKYPELAKRIRELFPTLMMLESAAGENKSSTAQRAGLAPGTIFGPYRIIREIGCGGMGIVYEAIQVISQRRLALKVLPLQALIDSSRIERFFREARITADLKHPNIVPIFDAGQISGTAYIAMKRIEGKGLDYTLKLLRQPEPSRSRSAHDQDSQPSWETPDKEDIPDDDSPDSIIACRRRAGVPILFKDYLKWAANLGIQAASALSYAHERGLIHRDIKPSNLILDKDGTLWIADFGLARKVEDSTLTSTGVLLGTPRYMSPEQAEASIRQVDRRTDIYSLGATLYELVTCHPVFEGKTPQEVLLQILARQPVMPRRLNHLIPTVLEAIVMKAMAKRPDHRYQSADELANDLQNWIRGMPVIARRENRLSQSLRWFRKNLRFAAVVIPLILALIIFANLYFRERARDPSPAQTMSEELGIGEGASKSEERDSQDESQTGISSLLVPVIEDPIQNDNGKQALLDAGKTSNSKQAIAEDARKKTNLVLIPVPAQMGRESLKMKEESSSSGEVNIGEAALSGQVASRPPSTKNIIKGKNREQPPPDADKNVDALKISSKNAGKIVKDSIGLQRNQEKAAASTNPIVDQSNIIPQGKPGWLAMSWTISQTFIPSMPVLTGVDIDILTANPHLGSAIITVQICDSKTKRVLATTSQAVQVGFTGLLHFNFAQEIPVTVGDTYVLHVPGSRDSFGWKYSLDRYPKGFRTTTSRRGSTAHPNQDCLFQTYGRPTL